MIDGFEKKHVAENRSFSGQIGLDFVKMAVLILFSVYFVYYSTPLYRDLFFLIPLFLFWRSKKNYFWFAYIFILLNEPGLLFLTRNMQEVHRLPYYTFLPSMSFSIIDLFVILAFIKAFIKGNKKEFVFSRPLKILMIYFVLCSLPVSWVFKTDMASLANSIRAVFYYTVIVSFFWLNRDESDIYAFGYLLLPALAIILASQVYLILTGEHLIKLISETVSTHVAINSVSGEVRPVMRAVLIVFFCLFFGLVLVRNRQFEIFRGLSEVIILAAFLSFVLSATRSWISIAVLSFTTFLLTSNRRFRIVTRFTIICGGLVIILLNLRVIDLDYFERNIWERYFPAVEAFSRGRISQTDTFIDRVENDIPKTLTGLKESPIVGVGLSDVYRDHYSNDLGFLNTILLFGGSGFVLFLYFLISFYRKLGASIELSHVQPVKSNVFIALRAVSLGVFLGYCLTWDFFSFYAQRVFFISLLIATAELTLFSLRESHFLRQEHLGYS